MFKNKLLSISKDGNYLSICNSEGVLRLWDTNSNILEHEFHPSEYLSSEITCSKLSSSVIEKNFKGTKKKSNTIISHILIALGTIEGSILVYSPYKQEVVAKFIHSSSSSVTDLSWKSGSKLVSIGDNKKLIIWNLENNKKKICDIDINECKTLCVLRENLFIVGTYSLQYLFYDKEEKCSNKSLTIPGHKSTITQLVPVFVNKEKDARFFLSAADGDRYVYAWSSDSDMKQAIASFMVNDIVKTISCITLEESSIAVAVTTQKGYLRIFRHHINGTKNKKPIQCEKSLRIQNATQKDSFLTILCAHFLSKLSSLMQKKETVISREDPSIFTKNKESNLVKNVTPHVSSKSVTLMPTQMTPIELKEVSKKRKKGAGAEESLPMEERLDALSLTQSMPGAPDSRPLDNYVHLLIQALRSKDTSLMNSILVKGEDEEIINNTVRRLPVEYVVPFLQFLQEVITNKALKNLACINWIRSVLFHHMSYLISVPEKEELLQPFHSIFEARKTCYFAVSRLHSRMSLLLTQVKNRHENTTQSVELQTEPLYKYKEDLSDDEDLRIDMGGGGPSESEDIWDDWTEDEEEEEEENSEESVKKKKGKVATKRKHSNEDDHVSLTDSDSSDEDEQKEDDDKDDDDTEEEQSDGDADDDDDDEIQSLSDED
ncbi:WD repeat-containing protein 43 [Armadillidium vulgare]|nr:WD repeat-containing protein 43 [Armadillidium vulgare]